MRYYIGIDGGGSKTRFCCISESGETLSECVSAGTYYRQRGAEAVIETIVDGIKTVTGGLDGELVAVSFGMPGYGEALPGDDVFLSALQASLAPTPLFAANDVAMAFNGAFAGGTGIMLVAGTGSMAWGRDETGRERRCGGWSELFGDEGSGYWVGRKAIELFSKESDGRIPKTAFYSIFRNSMGICENEDDLSLVSGMEALFQSRAKVASVHRLLLEAAMSGDEAAAAVYAQAVEELFLIVSGMIRNMSFAGVVPVSYVGGMFNCDTLITGPLKKRLQSLCQIDFCPPMLGPCQGAVLYAAERLGNTEVYRRLRDGMLSEEMKNV